MTFTRKGLFRNAAAAAAGTFAGIGVLRYPAGAAEFSYKFSTEQPPKHHMTLRLIEAAEKTKQESNGRLEIAVYPNSVLGGQTDILSQIRLGAVEFISAFDFTLANLVPVAGITGLPFAFSSHKQALDAMAGPLGAYRLNAIAKIGVYPFAHSWDEGFRQTVNSLRPVRTPADLKGVKIRTPDAPVSVALFKALGASPVSISSNEMYVSLQTHLADGAEQPIAAVEAYKLYEVQKYFSYTSHMWTGYTMLANAAAWQKLPKDLRDVFERNLNAAADLDNADVVKMEATLEGTLKGQGMIFNSADVPSFQAAVRGAGFYAQWKQTYGTEAWALLEKISGKLA